LLKPVFTHFSLELCPVYVPYGHLWGVSVPSRSVLIPFAGLLVPVVILVPIAFVICEPLSSIVRFFDLAKRASWLEDRVVMNGLSCLQLVFRLPCLFHKELAVRF
jgi:hypothetical protein